MKVIKIKIMLISRKISKSIIKIGTQITEDKVEDEREVGEEEEFVIFIRNNLTRNIKILINS